MYIVMESHNIVYNNNHILLHLLDEEGKGIFMFEKRKSVNAINTNREQEGYLKF